MWACLVHHVSLIIKCVLVMNLFVWCMSGAPCVFDGKTCARDKLIYVVCHVWLMVKLTECALVTSLLVWCMSSVP